MTAPLFKSILHNLGVVLVGLAFASAGVGLDRLFGIARFHSIVAVAIGSLLILLGFLLRVWATVHFYRANMKVVVLNAQQHLITSGPFRFSRNPLYLGGNVFIFLGAVLCLGSPSGIILTALNIVVFDRMIRREEAQLALAFGEQWTTYKNHVRRWL